MDGNGTLPSKPGSEEAGVNEILCNSKEVYIDLQYRTLYRNNCAQWECTIEPERLPLTPTGQIQTLSMKIYLASMQI